MRARVFSFVAVPMMKRPGQSQKACGALRFRPDGGLGGSWGMPVMSNTGKSPINNSYSIIMASW